MGLASGITLGLAFSFGGLTTPLLGWIADHHGLRATIGVVAFLPVLSAAFSLMLPAPKKQVGGRVAHMHLRLGRSDPTRA